MFKKIHVGSTSVSVPLRVADTSSVTGGGLAGLLYNTGGLVLEYRRKGSSAWTSVPLVTATLGTWVSGGFVADGSVAGAYELGLPNAALATGAAWVEFQLYGAANMLPVAMFIELDAVDYQDGNKFGLAYLPTDIPGNAGGMILAGTGANQLSPNGTGGLNPNFGLALPGTPTANTLGAAYFNSASIPFDANGLVNADAQRVGGAVATPVTGAVPANVTQWLGGAVNALAGSGNVVVELSTAAVLAVWNSLTSATYAAGSFAAKLAAWVLGTDGKAVISTDAGANPDTAGTATLLTRLTSTRAAYLDNLSAGPVATAAGVATIQNNTSVNLVVPAQVQRPTSGSDTRIIELYLFNEQGAMQDADALPTLSVTSPAGASYNSRLSATTFVRVSAGYYKLTYTNSSTDANEQVRFQASVVRNGQTELRSASMEVVDVTAVAFTSTDRTNLSNLANRIPGTVQPQTGDAFARLGAPATASIAGDIATRSAPATAQTIDQTTAIPTSPGAGSIGEAFKFADTRLDAAVSSRSTYAGADTAGTTSLLARLTTGRAGNLDFLDIAVSTRSAPATAQTIDQTTAIPASPGSGSIGEAFKFADTRLDAAVSTRLPTSGYTVPPTLSQIDTQLTGTHGAGSWTGSAGTADPFTITPTTGYTGGTWGAFFNAKLDAAISSRMATFAYAAPDNTGIAAIKAKTDNLPAAPADAATQTAIKAKTDLIPAGGIADSTTQAAIKAKTDNIPASGIADATTLAAVKAKTDNLPADPASNTQVNTRLATSGYTAPDNTTIGTTATAAAAIKAKTDLIPAGGPLAASGYTAPDNATIAATATSVGTGLGTAVTGIKAKTDLIPAGGPLAASGYTAPDNANIGAIATSVGSGLGTAAAAIKAKTDRLSFDGSTNNVNSNVVTGGGGGTATLDDAAVIADVQAALTAQGFNAALATSLQNVTGTGAGDRVINQDYGGSAGSDRLAFKNGPPTYTGIAGATIRAYLTADFNASNLGASFVKAKTMTDVFGRWIAPMALFPADYTLVYTLPNGEPGAVQEVLVS